MTSFGLMLDLPINHVGHSRFAHLRVGFHGTSKRLKWTEQRLSAGNVSFAASPNKMPYCTASIPSFLACVEPEVQTGSFVFQDDCFALFTWSIGRHRTHIINRNRRF